MKNNNKNLTIGLIGILVIIGLVFSVIQIMDHGSALNPISDNINGSSPIPQVSGYTINVYQAHQQREDGAFLLDVRTPEEWDQVHIPGAYLIPLDELQVRIDEVPKYDGVVIYCRSGNRSRQALTLLQDAGFTNVYSLAGGIQDWIGAGYPVE